MRKIIYLSILFFMLSNCSQNNQQEEKEPNKDLVLILDNYHKELLQLYPMGATFIGDNNYNDLLPVTFTDSYRKKLKDFYDLNQKEIEKIDSTKLNANDLLSYEIFKWEINAAAEGLLYHKNYFPFTQFEGVPLRLGVMGTGSGLQPFKTVKDYDDWIKRATAFNTWADSAIVYFRKGIEAQWVLPKALVVKMIPQMYDMVTDDVQKSIFYGPVKNMPANFSESEKQRLTSAYETLISKQIIPTYKKLGNFLKNEYLPRASNHTGFGDLPGGADYYKYIVRYWTTTNQTPDEIYNTGLAEVKRIRNEMDSVKQVLGFKGDLKTFFGYLRTDKKFMPYKTPEDVLNAFRAIEQKAEAHLDNFTTLRPKAKFVVKQTEAFRAATASVEYYPANADGSRPGVLYIPIVDASKFNNLMNEDLFLHEGIPGHYIQTSIQLENKTLPAFRQLSLNGEFPEAAWYGAYVEGWALYCETMGKILGCYTDPYQYMGYLEDEMHRAIRMVVDVGMHAKGMTREQAIQFSLENEPMDEAGVIAEIERYMAWPGQALCYKVGELKIIELMNKYKKELGEKFKLTEFNDENLKDGAMPLDVLEKKMDQWAKSLEK